ncbi:MAG: phage terminase small subunit P27 family [Gemmataceae bacterium]
MRGRPPTPTAVLKARGSWRAKTRKAERVLPVEAPSKPDWLQGEAAAEWDRAIAALLEMGILTLADRAPLAAYCEACGEFVELVQLIATIGREGNGALVRMKNKAAERIAKFGCEFGFSPVSRTRLKLTAPEPAASPKLRFFGPK